jgi:hypothetical protein
MIPPINSTVNTTVKDSCNCCLWPWKKEKAVDPEKIRGHKNYTITERIKEIVINIRESNK